MTIARRLLAAILLIVVLTPAAPSRVISSVEPSLQPGGHRPQFEAAIAKADADMLHLQESNGLPALQVAVLVEGKIVFSKAYGFADLDSRDPATTETRFRIASVSKAITGAVLARLVARGEIELDQPLIEYVPDLPEHWKGITARHLASHTSGIRHYRSLEIYSNRHYDSLTEALGIFKDDALRFEPGAQREYSTYGFTLLGVAMEFMTDTTFFDLARKEVLDPLEMSHTALDDPSAQNENVATPYLLDNQQTAHIAPPTDTSNTTPGRGMVSTAEDLVKLAWGVIEPGPLEAEAISVLREKTTTADGETHNYSLGWNVSGEPGNLRLSHGGTQPGSRCFLLADIDGRVGVAILCNARGAEFGFADVERVAGYFKEAK